MFDYVSPGPGPGKYGAPSAIGYPQHDSTKWRSPQYTIPRRYYTVQKEEGKQLGGVYNLSGLTRFGRVSAPAYSLQFKPTRSRSPSIPSTSQGSRRSSAKAGDNRRESGTEGNRRVSVRMEENSRFGEMIAKGNADARGSTRRESVKIEDNRKRDSYIPRGRRESVRREVNNRREENNRRESGANKIEKWR